MKYYIIAGEASGDLHGSNLMKAIYAQDSDASVRFWGGDLMDNVYRSNRKDGDSGGLVCHYKEGAVMGFWEVFSKAGKFLSNIRKCKKDLAGWNPDAVILIDYPGFNFRIAEYASRHGFRTFYYIAPKVWASREGRIAALKKYVDRLLIIFPFEIPYFKSKGIDAEYCGNPLADSIAESGVLEESRESFFKRHGIEDRPYIAMLAGSRKAEISTMMPVLSEFAKRMRAVPEFSQYRFIVAGAPARDIDDYEPYVSENRENGISIVFNDTLSVIRHSEAAIVNSGTASLETVLLGVPQVVGYIAGKLSYCIGKRIIKVKYISLGNLIADKEVFRELIQDDCNAENILEEVTRILKDDGYRKTMLDGYDGITKALGGRGASAKAAAAVISEITRDRRIVKRD